MTTRITTRGDFVKAVLEIWDESVAIFPELRKEYDVAVEWLTKTWTTAELEQPIEQSEKSLPGDALKL
jgi:hypothetical protein